MGVGVHQQGWSIIPTLPKAEGEVQKGLEVGGGEMWESWDKHSQSTSFLEIPK